MLFMEILCPKNCVWFRLQTLLKTGVHIERIKAAAIFLLIHRTASDCAAILPTPSKIIPPASKKHDGEIPKEFFNYCVDV